MKTIAALLALLVAGTGVHAAPLGDGGAYACGGVGSDARRELASSAAGSNLSLELFVAQGGEYLADVEVALIPVGAKGEALRLRTEGPLCYLRVPPGRYRIEATFEGVTRGATANVPAASAGPVHVALAFPKSVGDRQNDAASPEEKAQAARIP
jgi:hypothetical protein